MFALIATATRRAQKKTIVIGSGRKAVGMALALTTWTDKIVICTNGKPADMSADLLKKLEPLNIPVLEQTVTCVKSKDGEIKCVELENGMSLDCEQLFFVIGQVPADDLGAQLGCKRDEAGLIVVDEHNHTSVRNVYAAGDIIPGPQLAIAAAVMSSGFDSMENSRPRSSVLDPRTAVAMRVRFSILIREGVPPPK